MRVPATNNAGSPSHYREKEDFGARKVVSGMAHPHSRLFIRKTGPAPGHIGATTSVQRIKSPTLSEGEGG